MSGAEWGWNPAYASLQRDQLLTDAQRLLGSRVLPVIESRGDFTLNPARLVMNSNRSLFIYGFGDVFYWESKRFFEVT